MKRAKLAPNCSSSVARQESSVAEPNVNLNDECLPISAPDKSPTLPSKKETQGAVKKFSKEELLLQVIELNKNQENSYIHINESHENVVKKFYKDIRPSVLQTIHEKDENISDSLSEEDSKTTTELLDEEISNLERRNHHPTYLQVLTLNSLFNQLIRQKDKIKSIQLPNEQ